MTKAERYQKLSSEQELTSETKIYIRDLKSDTTWDQLKEAFSTFGEVVSLSVKNVTV